MRLLVVEGSEVYGRLLAGGLREAGFETDLRDTVSGAREALRRIDYAVLILDLGWPDEDGIQLIRELRSSLNTIPIVVTTARNSFDDRPTSLRSGADDYLVKPFGFDELLARLPFLLRRRSPEEGAILAAGNVELNPAGPMLRVGERFVEAGPREIQLLQLLLQHRHRVVTRDQLVRGLFGSSGDRYFDAFDVHLDRLRRLLKGAQATVAIETIRGIGYLMTELAGHEAVDSV